MPTMHDIINWTDRSRMSVCSEDVREEGRKLLREADLSQKGSRNGKMFFLYFSNCIFPINAACHNFQKKQGSYTFNTLIPLFHTNY